MMKFMRQVHNYPMGDVFVILGGKGAVTSLKTAFGWWDIHIHKPIDMCDALAPEACRWLGEMACDDFSPTEMRLSGADVVIDMMSWRYKTLEEWSDDDMWAQMEYYYEEFFHAGEEE